jgi:hypothetical protein
VSSVAVALRPVEALLRQLEAADKISGVVAVEQGDQELLVDAFGYARSGIDQIRLSGAVVVAVVGLESELLTLTDVLRRSCGLVRPSVRGLVRGRSISCLKPPSQAPHASAARLALP